MREKNGATYHCVAVFDSNSNTNQLLWAYPESDSVMSGIHTTDIYLYTYYKQTIYTILFILATSQWRN